MGFVSICTALYDYQPQSAEELELKEGELLYILDNDTGDEWWKAKKKAAGDDDDEPEGLIPYNYVQDAEPEQRAKALYDYARQTDEEVSFSEDASIDVYDSSDPDWTLVGVGGEFGFAPANYIEMIGSARDTPAATPSLPVRAPISTPIAEPDISPVPASPVVSDHQSAAASLARVLGGGAAQSPTTTRAVTSAPPPQPQRQLTPDASDEEEQAPALPRRPPSQVVSSPPVPQQATYVDNEPPGLLPSPPYNRAVPHSDREDMPVRSPGGFHMYNISEMVSVMGRRKKMPTTLGLNLATGTIMLSPERTRDGPTQEWTADKLNHYSIEGKHVFVELVRPSKSLDLHAGAKDTAQEIVRTLGEIAGAQKAEGFKEIIAAATSGGGKKRGVVLYEFMSQGDDECTVAVGDEVVVIDDEKSEEWWQIKRLKNGKEGMVPASYIEITGVVPAEPVSRAGVNAGKSTVEQNRLEEERITKEAAKRAQQEQEAARSREVQLPQRGSSLGDEDLKAARKEKKSGRSEGKSRSKPDPSKTRTWTDHSGTFKVDAQFIGIADGKIHLHKVNGVKIAVPVSKMSPTDLDYVEKLKRKNQANDASSGRAGASIEPSRSQAPDYDWFDLFLSSGVNPHQCERYAQAMIRDSMDESVLPDITTETLRNLGLKEGDALKVMKLLDQKFGRNKTNGTAGEAGQGGIFTGPGGALVDNSRRSRPDANRKMGDVVDAGAFDQLDAKQPPSDSKATPLAQAPTPELKTGFDDDAWEVKSPTRNVTASQQAAIPSPAPKPPSENLQALSLLDKPLEPTPAAPPRPASQPQISQPLVNPSVSPPPQLQSQQTGANPTFFNQLNQSTPQINAPRQRPQPPQQTPVGSSFLPPPPRPTSAPLAPQMTGISRNAVHPAGPGQSMDEITAQRMQQLQFQQTGYGQSYGGFQNGLQPQMTGYPMPQQFAQLQQPYTNGNMTGSPFADPRPAFQPQPTGYNLQPGPAPGSLNSILPPALVPQRTGFSPAPQATINGFNPQLQPQPTGYQQPIQVQATGWAQSPQQNGFGNIQLPPVPPLPQHITPAPLLPQKTGPAPDVRFGVEAKKLAPQPTGRRANLSAATPQNPFGF